MAYWTEDGELARRAGWEVREVKRPASFEEGVPKEWRTAYVVAPFGFDFSAVEKAVVERVDRAESGIAYIRPVEWPVPEAFLWFVLRDRWPYREGESVAAYSVDWLSVEERLLKLREAFKARDYREAGRIVRELSEAGETRTLWQLIYQFDKERASAALDYLRQKYNEPEDRLWERHDELYKVWLAFRLADEYEAYLKSGAGREMKKEEAAEVRLPGAWAPGDLMPLFWLRLLGDPEGGDVFKDVWAHAINIYYEGMTHPYTPKKKAAARRALELFNAYMQTSLKYEDLFPPEEARAEKTTAEEARRPARQTTSPQTAERAVVEAERAIKAEAVKAEEAVEKRAVVGKAEEAAPLPDLIPDGIDPVLYLVGRFGHLLDEDAADKARGFVYAKLRAKLEKIAAKEPELAAALAELAERVLWSLGGLLASPEAARHAHDALFYHFEGYYTKDGERLYERIRGAVEEAVRRAEEAGVIDAEHRVKQWVLTVVDILATAGERYRRDGLKAISTVEKALRATAFAGLSAASLYSLYQGLYSEAVVSAVASAVALAEAGQFKEAVERVKSAAEALYEEARELFERTKIAVQRLIELFVEAVAKALSWIDLHKAYLLLMAAVAAGLVALSYALDVYGQIELGRLAYAALGVAPHGAAAKRLEEALQRRWQVDAVGGEIERPFRDALAKVAEAYAKIGEALKRLEAVEKGPVEIDVGQIAEAREAWRHALDAVDEFRRAITRLIREKPKLRQTLKIDEAAARRLATATVKELSLFKDVNAGTKAYAALLSLAEGGIYGHAAAILLREGRLAHLLRYTPYTAYDKAREAASMQRVEKTSDVSRALLLFFTGLDEELFKGLGDVEIVVERRGGRTYINIHRAGKLLSPPLAQLVISKRGVARLAGGSLFKELKGMYEAEYLRSDAEILPVGRLPLLLGWLATDVTLIGNYVYASTTQRWQVEALRTLLGKPEKSQVRGFNVTLKGLKPDIKMQWRREVLDSIVKEAGWEFIPGGVEKFDDLIRLRWDAVINAVKEARGRLAKLITCRGEGRCGEEKLGEMLKELEAFAAKVEKWRRGEIRGEEVEKLYREARKYLAPALLLLELESAEKQEDELKEAKPEERQTALWRFALAFAAAVAGDGHVRRGLVRLTSGDGGAALLWLAALQRAGELAGFKPRLYVGDRYYRVEVSGMENVAALAALMPAVGLNPKAEKAVDMFREWAEEAGAVEVKLEAVEKTSRGAKAVVAVRAGPWEAKYDVYLRGNAVELRFNSTDVERVYQMAHVLKLLGVKAEPKKSGNKWRIDASTDVLASKAVLPLFREAIARAVEEAARRGWIKGDTAERWAEKLREGVTIAEDKPKFNILINNTGALDIIYRTTNAEKLGQYAEELKSLGLEEGVHLIRKEPEGGRPGALRITAEGVVKLAELSHHAESEEVRLKAAEWIKHLLARAEEGGGREAKEKLEALIEEGAARGALTLTGLRREVEVEGEKHVVEIKRVETRIDRGKLSIRVEAVVDGVEVEREYTFTRDRDNRTSGLVSTWSAAPGGREEDRRRLKALATVIFGEAGSEVAGGRLLKYTRRHLEHAMRFREVKEAAERWLQEGEG